MPIYFYNKIIANPTHFPNFIIAANGGASDEGDDEEVDDDATNDGEDDDVATDDGEDENMPKTAATKTKAPTKKKGGSKKTWDDDPIDVDSPPPKKKQRATSTRYFVDPPRGFTVNPYVQGSKNKIDIVLHEGGVPPQDAQPQVSLLPGGRMLSVQWKTPEKLYSDLQAAVQGIAKNSSRYTGYSDTMQLMVSAGVRAVDGYHRGAPQLIQLDAECTGNPKIKVFNVPTKKKVKIAGVEHMQFNCMYVVTLKVASERIALTAQPKNAGIADFGFLESQSSAEADRRGGGGGGGGGGDGGGRGGAGGKGRGRGGGGQLVDESSEDDSDNSDNSSEY